MQAIIRCQHTKLVPPRSLRPHPRNPNTHPDRQVKLLAAILKEQGWRYPIVVSKRSGFIISGHGRLQAALWASFEEVPIDEQDFDSEQQELEHLVADNQIQELAEMDSTSLEKITRELQEMGTDLQAMGFDKDAFRELEEEAGEEETVDKVSDDNEASVHTLKDDIVFKTPLRYGIPEIRSDMLAEAPLPITTWIGPIRTERWEHHYLYVWQNDSIRDLPMDRTAICFYTEDEKFVDAWNDPVGFTTRLLNLKPHCVLGANYSLWAEMPEAVMIYNTYRARWVTRYWQEAGLRVIPDVNFSAESSWDFCFVGIPQNAPCLAMQVQTAQKSVEEVLGKRKGITETINRLKPQSLLIYGGDTAYEILDGCIPKSLPYTLVDNAIMKRRKFIRK